MQRRCYGPDKNVMPSSHATLRVPDVPPEERALADAIKRIRKLRWIGQASEGQKLQVARGAESNVAGFAAGEVELPDSISARHDCTLVVPAATAPRFAQT